MARESKIDPLGDKKKRPKHSASRKYHSKRLRQALASSNCTAAECEGETEDSPRGFYHVAVPQMTGYGSTPGEAVLSALKYRMDHASKSGPVRDVEVIDRQEQPASQTTINMLLIRKAKKLNIAFRYGFLIRRPDLMTEAQRDLLKAKIANKEDDDHG